MVVTPCNIDKCGDVARTHLTSTDNTEAFVAGQSSRCVLNVGPISIIEDTMMVSQRDRFGVRTAKYEYLENACLMC